MSLEDLLRAPAAAPFPWDLATSLLPTLDALRGCPQDPVHHQEGDVWVHTRRVCEALWAEPGLHRLARDRRDALVFAALLHDIAKPATRRVDAEGRIRNPGHARRGAIEAERILWELGLPFAVRRLAVALVRFHLAPFHVLDRQQPPRLVHGLSWQLHCSDLGLLALADTRGRCCPDQAALEASIGLFVELCREERCLDRPRDFASDHSRALYFRKEARASDYHAYDDTWGEVVLLSGLPGAGKNRFVARHLTHLPTIDLDAIRGEMRIAPTAPQGAVINEARARARAHLRDRRPFAWNATNLSEKLRTPLIELCLGYGARVKIVYVEATPERLWAQNAAREDAVPPRVITRLMDRWEVPTAVEAHVVEHWIDGHRTNPWLG